MGDRRSKEDCVLKISTSIFITNFLDQFYARDIWRVCEDYGKVIDAYISNIISKAGKRFGFLCFIKIEAIDRLIQQACKTFNIDGRVTWVDIEGVPLSLWSQNTFARISSKWGEMLYEEDKNELYLHRKRICIKTTLKKIFSNRLKLLLKGEVMSNEKEDNKGEMDDKQSEDPFNIYELLNKKKLNDNEDVQSEDNMKYPLGFTPGMYQKNIDLRNIMMIWGNYTFEFAISPSVGNSGGVWVPSSSRMLIISVYAPQEGAEAFNLFIALGGLVDVPLGGYIFIWFLSSASKMIDYGPVPFRLYHYWFNLEGFDKMVEDTWNEEIYQGDNDVELVAKQTKIINSIHDIERLENTKLAQKAKINLQKIKVMGNGVSFDQVEKAAYQIGCVTFTPPFSYLGVKVGGMMSRISTWNEVIQRLLDRLSKWKMKTLSIGGRLTLLKSVLGSMHTYHMSLFKTPMKVLNTMESIRSQFFNGMKMIENKMVWVGWSNVLASKQKAIHGNDGHLMRMPKTSRSSIWLDIVREVFHLKQQGIDFFCCKNVGNGEETLFWDDVWFGNFPLKDKYHRGGAESEQFNKLSSKLLCVILPQSQDRWVWSLEGSGDFSVASIRNVLDDFKLPEVSSQTRWSSVVRGKINIFAWNVRQKVIIQGKVYWIRVKELDAWFPNFQEDDQDDLSSDGKSQEGDVINKADNNESDVDIVSKSSFMHENDTAHKDNNVCNSCNDEPKFPPDFTPDNNDQEKNVEENIKDTTQRVQSFSNKLNDRCSNHGFSSQRSMNSHSQKSKVGRSILDLMDELVTVGQTMGYNMAGLGNKAKRRRIKELCQRHRINFASIQKTKAESISLHTIKDLWRNQMFDHVVGSSVGCSGGILCMWNPNMFVKEQVSTCDYFVVLMGTWAPTSYKLFIISVYAPQELNERRDLWDYLRTFIDRWKGDTVIMGDFNEGFNSFVETTWKSLNIVEPNGLIRLKKKLQALKIAIKAWSKEANKRSNDKKINIQQNLSEVDKLIDQGKSNDEILIKRTTLLNDLQELNNRNSMEISQKAKIRWSIEGDENSKYFHGLKINLHKSKLMGICVSSNVVTAAASLIGCSILTAPFNYLDVKVGSNMSRITSWDDVISKVSSRLSKWKLKLLSIGGRLSLLSVLTSISLYHMSIFKVPIGVLNCLKFIRQNFFYGVDGLDRKLAWIGWNMVLNLKKEWWSWRVLFFCS
nr:RNA-directed DNA polymerase, eukaryota [Tanacetum cinerariifolium]